VNWEAISAIGQMVGAIAVVISLIYLAREVRSNARATRYAAMRATLDNFNRLAQLTSEDSDLAELYYRGLDDFEALERLDYARFNTIMHQIFRNMEDVYHQHLEGHLDPRVWPGLEVFMRGFNSNPGVQAWWRSHSHWFSGEEFAKFINQQQQTAEPPRMFREPIKDE
jgi:hypothetical protein